MLAVPLCQSYCFSCPLAQVVELCAPDFSAPDGLDIEDIRRMKWENAFDAFVIYDAPDSEILVDSPSLAAYHSSCKDLDAFLIAFLNPAVNIDYVTYLKMRYLFLEALALNGIQNCSFHWLCS